MSYFDTPAKREGTNSVKWNKGAIENISANPEALPFWVADMDFLPEPHVREKAKEMAELGVFGYPTFPDFKNIAASWLEKKHHWTLDPSTIVFSQG
ncbi:MAG: cystathionine beta-lyase, partial [Spirochaetales bacterium]|nr:cystathionine beta-lyase [Candidatus Physcosoma equi]